MAIATVAKDNVPSAQTGQAAFVWGRFRRHRSGVVGLVVLALLAVAVIVVPALSPFGLYTPNTSLLYAPAGTVDTVNGQIHWLGTDHQGRDVMLRLFIAGRVSLFVALISTLLVVIIGSLLGALAGYYGGFIDTVLMRLADMLLAIPILPLFLIVFGQLKQAPALSSWWSSPELNPPLTLATIAGVFTLFSWMGLARLVRGSVLSLRSLGFMEAARALGASNRRIIFRHLLPNSIAPIVVAATFSVGDFIILESILAYFSKGISDPPFPSWGNMLVLFQGLALNITNLNPFQDIRGWLFLMPAIMVLITVLSINYVGDALRSTLDPHRTD